MVKTARCSSLSGHTLDGHAPPLACISQAGLRRKSVPMNWIIGVLGIQGETGSESCLGTGFLGGRFVVLSHPPAF